MTTSWPLAPPGQDWGRLDPLLGALADAVGSEAEPGQIHQIRWRPGEYAGAAYGVRSPDAPADGAGLVAVHVTPAGTRRTPLSDDLSLPGAVTALDPQEVSRRLAGACGGPVTGCTVTPVSYRPGSRCVLRYDVATAGGPRTFYAKLLSSGHGRYVDSTDALLESARTLRRPLLVPPVVATWEDAGAVVTVGVDGPTLSSRLVDAAAPAQARTALTMQLGKLLAAVHATPTSAVPAAPSVSPGADLAELLTCLPAAWHADPLAAFTLSGLVHDLSACPPQTRGALGHGALRPGQVVVRDDGLTLLDLDGISVCDPARDVGNAMAYLQWQAVRRAIQPGLVPQLLDALLRGYASTGGVLDPTALGWWRSVAMAKIAGRRYRSLSTGEWALVPQLLDAAREALYRPLAAASSPRPGRLPRQRAASAWSRRSEPPELLDPVRMTDLLRPALAPLAGGPVAITNAKAIGAARGRRAVVRYEVIGLEPRPVHVIAKVYAEPERAEITYRSLRALSEGPFAGLSRAGVPAPLAVLPARGLVVYREAAGSPLAALDPQTGSRAVRAGADWLRRLHSADVQLDRVLDLDRELRSLQAWTADIARHDEAAGRVAEHLARALADAAEALPAVTLTPIHKDFHAGHVLVARDGTVTVIDLDEARMGDPALDLAHVCTYFEESGRPEAATAFAEAYGPLTGPAPRRRLAFYSAYTRLKIGKQLARGSGPLARGADPVTGTDLVALLDRGSTCVIA